MIILDTNVASEPMTVHCDPAVTAWFDRQRTNTLCITAINLAELMFGIALLREGRRKQGMVLALIALRNRISGTILPFDEDAAKAYSELMTRTRSRGQALSQPDGQIAAIATVHGFAVATRDVAPFVAAGVRVINPWQEI